MQHTIKLKTLALISLIILVLNVALYSQQNNLLFNRLSVDDGLSQSHVECIMQDSKGFIWIATQDGLNKFDGYELTVYRNNPEDSSSIAGNRITHILEDADGIIWIATFFNGVCSYNRITDKFTQYKLDPKNKAQHFVRRSKEPFYYFDKKNGKINRFNGSRKSIGGVRAKRSKLFYGNIEINLKKEDVIYLTSDGYLDQNAPDRKKIGTLKFIKILNNIKIMS